MFIRDVRSISKIKSKRVLFSLLIIFILGIIILSSSKLVSAEQSEIHKDWHEYSDSFKLDNKVFALRLSDGDASLLRVKIDNDTIFVKLGNCADYDIYSVCFIDESIEAPTATFLGATARPGIQIRILKTLGPNVDLASSLPNINIQEIGTVKLTLTNNEALEVDSFRLELLIPSGVMIKNTGDFILEGNKLIQTGTMHKNADKLLTFDMASPNSGNAVFNYTLLLTGSGVVRNKTGSISVPINAPYQIDVSLTPQTPNIQEESTLLISVKNQGLKKLNINYVQIRGPIDVMFTSVVNLSWTGIGRYELNNMISLDMGESTNFYLKMLSENTGVYNITGNILMHYEGMALNYSFVKSTTYSANGMAPSLLTNKDEVLSGNSVEVVYYLIDTSSNMYFYNMTASIKGVGV